MGARVDSTKVPVQMDQLQLERWFAQQINSRSVVDDADFSNKIDAMTDANFLLLMRAFIKQVIKVG